MVQKKSDKSMATLDATDKRDRNSLVRKEVK
jgi:hypothetical protein